MMNLSELFGQRPTTHDESHCGVESTLLSAKKVLTELPSEATSDKELFAWALKQLRDVASEAAKGARKQELQLELRLLDAPDLETDEHAHTRKHFDLDQFAIEIEKRQSLAWAKFIEIVEQLEGK